MYRLTQESSPNLSETTDREISKRKDLGNFSVRSTVACLCQIYWTTNESQAGAEWGGATGAPPTPVYVRSAS